ncbi:MAG: glycosyltransferase [Xenococcaceae cyanobacterium]
MTKNYAFQHRYSLIFPNIFGFKGGIQVYSAFLLKALQELYPKAKYDVFLKYDRDILTHLRFISQTRFYCFGRFPRLIQSIMLAVQIIWSAIWQRPQLIICTHVNYSVVCYLLKHLLGVSYWVVAHGLEVWNLEKNSLKLALNHADKVVAVSHYTRSRLLSEQQLEATQVVVLPNTFDETRFRIAPKPDYLLKRYGLTPQQQVILTVTRLGRSAWYKGYANLLNALVSIRKQIPDAHYIIAGKGDDRPWIEAQVQKLNLSDCVTLAGFVPDEELCDHYNLCDIFALPSQGEGFGIVYLEALACGKPVLAGNRDGAVDPLSGGQLGCLVDPEDINAIAASLIQILQGTYHNRLIYQPQILRQEVIKRYALDKFTQTLANLVSSTPV